MSKTNEATGVGQKDARPTPEPALELRGVSFSYARAEDDPVPAAGAPLVLDHADLSVPAGAFALLVGGTGSGKTTLLRLCKPEIRPEGELSGAVRVLGRDVRGLSPRESASLVGYVFQSPDSQIVCDSVWHELAFGLAWFHRRCASLSGGQRQLLALASVLCMRPRLLLLDEPTSMLDPVAEKSFLSLLFRVNRELGCTVVVATHNPGPILDFASMAFAMEGGRPHQVPLESLAGEPDLLAQADATIAPAPTADAPRVVRASGAWLRYEREAPWVLRGCDLELRRGEVRALVGGNGSGKSTLIMAVAGMLRLQRGRVANELAGSQALLPQQPKALLSQPSASEELMEWSSGAGYTREQMLELAASFGLADALDRHPYDLSGGQQQLLALAKLLLTRPRLLLLDEPTKGLDNAARALVARHVRQAAARGATVLLSTHDAAFARAVADTCSLLFDGQVALTQPAARFFAESWVWHA